jgi:hypothetical protein
VGMTYTVSISDCNLAFVNAHMAVYQSLNIEHAGDDEIIAQWKVLHNVLLEDTEEYTRWSKITFASEAEYIMFLMKWS